MKILFLSLSFLFCSQSFAAKCLLKAAVVEKSGCSTVTTRLEVRDQSACEKFAKQTDENNFFGTLTDEQDLASIEMTFKNGLMKKKEIKVFEFSHESDC